MLLGAAAYCGTHMVVGYGDILKRLDVVMPHMLKCGVCVCRNGVVGKTRSHSTNCREWFKGARQ
jgi:hypothetical protein